jgi:hypothetical protein
MGQGLYTKVAQVVATEFGLPLSAIRTATTDTSKVPNTSATAASSGADLNGKAAQAAASTLRKRLVAHACAKYRVGADRVRFAGGEVHVGKRTLTFGELVASAYAARVSLSSTGFYATPKLHWDRSTFNGRPFFYFAYGAAVSEVAIDTLTGETRLLRVDILHDVGTSLNPAIDMGQIEGGFLQGVGWLTSEELYWNDRGELQTHAPSTYKIPSVRDWPVEAHIRILEHEPNREDTIHRSKAVGEPPLMLCISTFLAIRDAVAACAPDGHALPDLRAPATPEAILRALDSLLPPGEGGPKGRMRVGDREGVDKSPDPTTDASLEERSSAEESSTQMNRAPDIDMPWRSPTLTPTPLPEGEGLEAVRPVIRTEMALDIAHRQSRVIRQHRSNSRRDRRTARAPALHIRARRVTGNPFRHAVGQRRAPVDTHRKLDANPWPFALDAAEEAPIEVARRVMHQAGLHDDAGIA